MFCFVRSSRPPHRGRRAPIGVHARWLGGRTASGLAVWRLTRFSLLLLCKLALVLTIAQVPGDVVGSDMAEVAQRVSEECLLTEDRSERGGRRQANLRPMASGSLQRCPIRVDQRAISRGHAHGHLLNNGLRAPLRC
jgi:hypothetical protein